MAAASPQRISGGTVRKSVKALLKWKDLRIKSKQSGINEEETDNFMYLSLTLKKIPPESLTLLPHRIPLRHSLFPEDYALLRTCLIIDGKKITFEAAHKILKSQDLPITQILKLSKLKSDYKSYDSKKKLYDSFDVFFSVKGIDRLLPKVLGKVFYKKKKKIPVPLDLRVDGNWKEEVEKALASSLLCLSGGVSSSVRVGSWGMESGGIVENVLQAIDGMVEVVPRKWRGIRCIHLKFSDSAALPIYEDQAALLPDDGGELGAVGKKMQQESGRKE